MLNSDKSSATLPWNQSGGAATSISRIGSNLDKNGNENEANTLDKAPCGLDSLSPTLFSGKGARAGDVDNGQVKQLLTWAGKRCGLEEFAERIKVVWNYRFTATLGRATFRNNQIELSAKMWSFHTSEKQSEVLIHEACHLFVHELYSRRLQKSVKKGHGPEWMHMMNLCGYKDSQATTSAPLPGTACIANSLKQYVVYCRCKSHIVTPQVLGRLRRGMKYYCKECNSDVMSAPYES